MIEVRGLTKTYGTERAVDTISFEVKQGEVLGFLGPNGAGKTTTMKVITGYLPPTEGTVYIDGEDIYGQNVNLFQLRKKVGMVFQKSNPFPKSIFENVAYGLKIHGLRNADEIRQLVEKSLTRADLWHEVKDRLLNNALDLSGGQQQRLCIARALAVNPEILLMDEPASALDPISTTAIEDLMHELKTDYTIVIVTHNMQQAARVADMTAFFSVDVGEDGQRTGVLVEYDETQTIFTTPADPRTEGYVTGRFG